jgi:hypothetical protein
MVYVPVQDELLGHIPIEMSVQCVTCKWKGEALRCVAFPDNIPRPILEGEVDHTNPYLGDNGYRYEAL